MSEENHDNIETTDNDESGNAKTSAESISDERLKKMVSMLKKQTGIGDDKLKGKTLEQQFDLLSFAVDVMPKEKKKTGNKPVIPMPTATDKPSLGKLIESDGNTRRWNINIKDLIKK